MKIAQEHDKVTNQGDLTTYKQMSLGATGNEACN